MLWELYGTDIVVCCGNCREQIVLCVGGIVGNGQCRVLWILLGTNIIVSFGNCKEQILLFVVGIVGNR